MNRLLQAAPKKSVPVPPMWADRARWQASDPQWVFLLTAADRLGKVVFGDDWKGDEFAKRKLEGYPEPSLDTIRQQLRNLHLVRPALSISNWRNGAVSQGPTLTEAEVEAMAVDQYKRALDFTTAHERAVQAHNEKVAGAISRAAGLTQRFQQWALDGPDFGGLLTGLRYDDRGGQVLPIPNTFWHGGVRGRLETGKLWAAHPINPPANLVPRESDLLWVYVGRESLEALIARLERATPKPKVARSKEAEAEADLKAAAEAYRVGNGPKPVREEWRLAHGLSKERGGTVWGRVAVEYPEISAPGRPKRMETAG